MRLYDDEAYSKIYLRIDSAHDISTRAVYTFLEFCGDIGGLLEIMVVLGSIIVGVISEK